MLQKVLETEPDRLMPLITVEQHRVIAYIAAYFLPLLERDRDAGLLAAGRRPGRAAPSTWPGWRSRSSPRPAATTSSDPDRGAPPASAGELLGGMLA